MENKRNYQLGAAISKDTDKIINFIRNRSCFIYDIVKGEFIDGGELLAVANLKQKITVGRAISKHDETIKAIVRALIDESSISYLAGWYNKDSEDYELQGVTLKSDIIAAYNNIVLVGQLELYDFNIEHVVPLSTLHVIVQQLSFNDNDKARQLYAEYRDIIKSKKSPLYPLTLL